MGLAVQPHNSANPKEALIKCRSTAVELVLMKLSASAPPLLRRTRAQTSLIQGRDDKMIPFSV
jgi:hypothetical protein